MQHDLAEQFLADLAVKQVHVAHVVVDDGGSELHIDREHPPVIAFAEPVALVRPGRYLSADPLTAARNHDNATPQPDDREDQPALPDAA